MFLRIKIYFNLKNLHVQVLEYFTLDVVKVVNFYRTIIFILYSKTA